MRDENKLIVKKIFVYHGIHESPELNEIWLDDFSRFNLDEVESAWNEWRSCPDNDKRKPRSMEIIRLIKAKRKPVGLSGGLTRGKLRRNRSFVEDLLIERLQKMNRHNPNLLGDIKKCETTSEKILMCSLALNEDLENNAFANRLIKIINKKTENYS